MKRTLLHDIVNLEFLVLRPLINEEEIMSIEELGLVAAMLVGLGIVRFGVPALVTWGCCQIIRRVNPAT